MSFDEPGYQPELNFSSETEFFSTPARNSLVQQILHLAEFGNGVVVVEGESGSGKSSFTQHLVGQYQLASPSENIKTIYIQLPDPIPVEAFFEFLCEQIGLPVIFESTGQILADLRNYVQNLIREQKLTVLVIDDASSLNDETLAALFSVLDVDVSSCGLQLVLTGLPGFSSRLDGLAPMELGVHDFSMPYFSPTELENFIQELFPNLNVLFLGESADWTRQSLWSQSRGIPGSALKLLQATNSASESQPQESVGSAFLTHFKWPFVHSAILIVLLAGFLWLVFGREDVDQSSRVSLGDDTGSISEDVLGVQSKDSSAGVVVGEALRAPSIQSVREGGSASVRQSKHKEASADLSQTVIGDDGKLIEHTKPSVLLAKEKPAAKEPTQMSLGASKSGLSKKEDASSVREDFLEDDTVEDLIKQQTSAQKTSESSGLSVRQPSQSEDAAESDDGRVLTADEQFLLSLPKNDYVLQILAVSQKGSALAFIKENADSTKMHLYQTVRQNKPWFVVVIASFSSRQAAAEGVSRLPSKLKKSGPWVKPLLTVFEEIGENS